MDIEEQGPDQREQLISRRRTSEEWDELACKLILLDAELALAIRDFPWEQQWKVSGRYMSQLTQQYNADQKVILYLGCKYEAYPMGRIAKSLRKLAREACQTLQPEARKREYYRDYQRRLK
jgi:hypothetical protein